MGSNGEFTTSKLQ